jgi:hypothetical protein
MTNTTNGLTTATLTLERFAALESAWPDTIAVTGGVLLARIHPRNNRPQGDEAVLARALVFLPSTDYGSDGKREGSLGRLTIRTSDVTYAGTSGIREEYAELLRAVLMLPVIELESTP